MSLNICAACFCFTTAVGGGRAGLFSWQAGNEGIELRGNGMKLSNSQCGMSDERIAVIARYHDAKPLLLATSTNEEPNNMRKIDVREGGRGLMRASRDSWRRGEAV